MALVTGCPTTRCFKSPVFSSRFLKLTAFGTLFCFLNQQLLLADTILADSQRAQPEISTQAVVIESSKPPAAIQPLTTNQFLSTSDSIFPKNKQEPRRAGNPIILYSAFFFPSIKVLSSSRTTTKENFYLSYEAPDGTIYHTLQKNLVDGLNIRKLEASYGQRKIISYAPILVGSVFALPLVNLLTWPNFSDENTAIHTEVNGTAVSIYDGIFREGKLTDGYVKEASGIIYYINSGKIAIQFNPDKSRIYFDEEGRVQAKISPLTATYFSYEYSADGKLLHTTLQKDGEQLVLDPEGLPVLYQKNMNSPSNLVQYAFTEGKISKIRFPNRIYSYYSRETSEGHETLFSEMKYYTSDQSDASSYVYPKHIIYGVDQQIQKIELSNNQRLEFDEAGRLARVLDASGREVSSYDFGNDFWDPENLISVQHQGVINRYNSGGSLKEVENFDGTKLNIENGKITQVNTAEYLFTNMVFDDKTKTFKEAHVVDKKTGESYHYGSSPVAMASCDTDNGKIIRCTDLQGSVYRYNLVQNAQGKNVYEATLEVYNYEGKKISLNSDQRVQKVEETKEGKKVVTDFEYDAEGRVHKMAITQEGIAPFEFIYTYEGGNLQVQNSEGTIRYYDSNGTLKRLTTSVGEAFTIENVKNSTDQTAFLQTLTHVTTTVGQVRDYEEGKLVELHKGNLAITNIVLDETGQLRQATIDFSDGWKGKFENGQLIELSKDGTTKFYVDNYLRRISSPGKPDTVYTFSGSNVEVQDELGWRMFDAAGVLRQAIRDSNHFDFDASGQLSKIHTPDGIDYMYKAGTLTEVRFPNGKVLNSVKTDGNGAVTGGNYRLDNSNVYQITNGLISHWDAPNSYKANFNPDGSGTVSRSDLTVTYNSSNRPTHMQWSGGKYIRNISANGQDVVTDGILYYPATSKPSEADLGVNEYRIQGGKEITFASDDVAGNGVARFLNPNNRCRNCWASDLNATLGTPNRTHLEIVVMGNSGNYTFKFGDVTRNIYLSMKPSTWTHILIPLPNGKAPFIVTPANGITFQQTGMRAGKLVSGNAPSEADDASPFIPYKTRPATPSEVTNAIQKHTGLLAQVSQFKAQSVTRDSLKETKLLEFQVREEVNDSKLHPSIVIQAKYDSNLTLIETKHSNPSFNSASDPNGNWKKSVSGWEDQGFAFGPVASRPPESTPLKILYSEGGEITEATLEGGMKVQYKQNRHLSSVLTPDGKTWTYSYQSNNPEKIDQIVIQPQTGTAEKNQIVRYDSEGRIKDILNGEEIIYQYSYEILNGKSITVIEDVLNREVRKFSEGRLHSVESLTTGFMTEYEYLNQAVKKAITKRAGNIVAEYEYFYSGNKVEIREKSGGIRRYDDQGNLKELITPTGETYAYSSITDNGQELVLQQLTQIQDSIRGTAQYKEGVLVSVLKPDQTSAKNIVLNNDGTIRSALVYLASERKTILIDDNRVLSISVPDGLKREFQDDPDGFTEKWINANQNVVQSIKYKRNVEFGIITGIEMTDHQGVLRTYSPDGKTLTGVNAPGVGSVSFDGSNKPLLIKTQDGNQFLYREGNLLALQLANGQGNLTDVELNSDGTLKNGTYKITDTTLTIRDGRVIKREVPNITYYYSASGTIEKIEQWVSNGKNTFEYSSGNLTAVTLSDGSRATGISTDSNNVIKSGLIYSPSLYPSSILNEGLNQFERNMSDGQVETFPLTGVSGIGPFRRVNNVLISSPNVDLEIQGNGANYLKLHVIGSGTYSVTFSPGNYVHGAPEKTVSMSFNYPSGGDVYLQIPHGPAGGLDYSLFEAITVYPAHNLTIDLVQSIKKTKVDLPWASIPSQFKSQKAAPTLPSIVSSTLAKRVGLENTFKNYQTQPGPAEIHQGDAQKAMESVRQALSPYLNDQLIVAALYTKTDGKLVTSARGDSTIAYYQDGQIQKVNDRDGNILVKYSYHNSMLQSVQLLGARNEVEKKFRQVEHEINSQKVLVLRELAAGLGQSTAEADKLLQEGLAQIEQARSQALREKQSTQVKVCGLVLFFKVCRDVEYIFTEEDIHKAFDEQENQLRNTVSAQLAGLSGQIQQKKTELEATASQALSQLQTQRSNALVQILNEELRPIIFNTYRKTLGRDPSKDEIQVELDKALTLSEPKVDVSALSIKLKETAEYQTRLQEVNAIKAEVRNFLLNQYLPASAAEKVRLASELKLDAVDVLPLNEDQAKAILDWLDAKDLHFGHSAFYAIQELLKQKGITVSLKEIALKTIEIDILSGVLHPLIQGDLEISLFALQKFASIYDVNYTAAEVSFDELKRQIGGNNQVLVHINGNHYVVVTGMGVRDKLDASGQVIKDAAGNAIQEEFVTYLEKNTGPSGESVSLSKEEFLKLWAANPQGTGVVLTPARVSSESKILNSTQTKQITGAFFEVLLPFILAIFSLIQAVFTVVLTIVATVATAIANLASTLLSVVGNLILKAGEALFAFAKFAFEGVHYVAQSLVRGIFSGFNFLKQIASHFSQILHLPKASVGGALTPSQLLARQIIGMAINYGSGQILDAIGADTTFGRLLAAFISGATIGFTGNIFGAGSSTLSTALQSLILAGLKEIPNVLNLPPPLLDFLSLAASKLSGAILDPSQFPDLFKDILSFTPQLLTDLTALGLTEYAVFYGFDPRLAQIMGNIGASITASTFFYDSVKDIDFTKDYSETLIGKLLRGSASIGISYLTDGIEQDYLKDYLQKGFEGGIDGMFDPDLKISGGVEKAYKDSLIFTLLTDPETRLLNALKFGLIVERDGIAKAFEAHAFKLFDPETLDAVSKLGGFDKLFSDVGKNFSENTSQITLADGRIFSSLKLSGDAAILFDQDKKYVGIQIGNVTYLGELALILSGGVGVTTGEIVIEWDGGEGYFLQQFRDGKLILAYDNIFKLTQENGQINIEINFGEVLSLKDRQELSVTLGINEKDVTKIHLHYKRDGDGNFIPEIVIDQDIFLGKNWDLSKAIDESVKEQIDKIQKFAEDKGYGLDQFMNYLNQPSPEYQGSYVYVKGTQLMVRERRPNGTLAAPVPFVAQGVNWSPASSNTEVFGRRAEFFKWYQYDIPKMKEMGITSVRIYEDFGTTPEQIEKGKMILDAFQTAGIKVIMEVTVVGDNEEGQGTREEKMLRHVEKVIKAYKNHPAILMWQVGNEWDLNFNYEVFSNFNESLAFIQKAVDLVDSLDKNHPITTVIADIHDPSQQDLNKRRVLRDNMNLPHNLPSTRKLVTGSLNKVDVWGLNIYRGQSFMDLFEQWNRVFRKETPEEEEYEVKPMYIAEFGTDSFNRKTEQIDYKTQAQTFNHLWDEIYYSLSAKRASEVAVGGYAFSWNDEWWKQKPHLPECPAQTGVQDHCFNHHPGHPDGSNEEEDFGLFALNPDPNAINRIPKTEMVQAVTERFTKGGRSVQKVSKPVITIQSQVNKDNPPGGQGRAIITLNGKVVFNHSGGAEGYSGFNVAILDSKTGTRLEKIKYFNTNNGGRSAFEAMAKFLQDKNEVPDGSVILIATADNSGMTFGTNKQIVIDALKALGSVQIQNLILDGGFAMIAIQGKGLVAEDLDLKGIAELKNIEVSLP